ncbi:MAG TPA: hypothetical protein VNZ43_15350 [Sphingomonadaceae bacterium]|nr:hypothetical protein [Sphingomonadaceae bacterium]
MTGRDIFAGDLADLYLDALVARDPGRLPLSANVRFSENGQSLPIDSGLWRTAGGPITYRFPFVDSASGAVGLFAVLPENGQKTILAARIALENGLVTELETIVVRRMGALFAPDRLTEPRPLFLQALPPEERLSRADMIRAADLYFEGIERDDGAIIPFSADCHRVENGVRVTGTHDIDERTIYTETLAGQNPADQISSGFFHYIKRIRDRRYPIVDRERGLVAAIVMFDHPADDLVITRPDGSQLAMPKEALSPSSALLYYLFKIRAGEIAGIEVAYIMLPYRSRSAWLADGEG